MFHKPEHWNLFFEDLKSDNVFIERFLHRVERMDCRYNITQNRLVDGLSVLLKGDAFEWNWLFVERHENVSWNTLKSELINRFQVHRSEDVRFFNPKQNFQKKSVYDFYSVGA